MSSHPNDLEGIIVYPPNSSSLLLDSKNRNEGEDPGNFSCYLSAALVARQLEYRNLQWTTPFFTHTSLNNEIRFQVEDNDIGDDSTEFVCYASPWKIFKSFDGNPPGGGFKPNQPGSYARDIQAAFNSDVRLLTSNTVPITLTVSGGKTLEWFFQYNQGQGFILFCVNSDGDNVSFRINDCSWITEAYNVHGFGILDLEVSVMRPKFYDDTSIFYEAYLSESLPILTTAKNMTVYSDQLTRERRLPSFENITRNQSFSDDSNNFSNELAILPILLDNIGRYVSNIVEDERTNISIREGSEASFLSIRIMDNLGRKVSSGNPIANFLMDDFVPPDVRQTLLNLSDDYRSPVAMNYLMFGFNKFFQASIIEDYFETGASVMTCSNISGLTSGAVYVHSNNTMTTDTSSGWQSFNSSYLTKVNNRQASIIVTQRLEITASTIVAPTNGRGILYFHIDSVLSVPSFSVDSDIIFAVDSSAVGNTYNITYTIPDSLLTPLILGNYILYEKVQVVSMLGGESVSITQMNVSNTKKITVTTVGNEVDPGYVPPYTFQKYGKNTVTCLYDDLVHMFRVYY